MRAGVHQKKPAEKPKDIDWAELYKMAEVHMITSLCFSGVNRLEEKPPQVIYERWKEKADKALVKEILFDEERRQILEAFEQANIKYVPLKGILLKNLYPYQGLRQFSDNDILYEKERQDDVFQIMTKLGYEGELGGNHDVYQKQPIFNFELHIALLSEENEYEYYFRDIWQRVVRVEENRTEYHMTEEDFYLFHIVHFEKHFHGGGTGLRYFADQYYLQKCMSKEFKEAIHKKLETLGLATFEQHINELTQCLFSDETVCWTDILENHKDFQDMFTYVMSCGAYGTIDNMIENRMKKAGGKFQYFLSRLTCDDVFMKKDYPILVKHYWLKPVFVVWRLVRAPFAKTDRVKAEFRAIFGKQKSKR